MTVLPRVRGSDIDDIGGRVRVGRGGGGDYGDTGFPLHKSKVGLIVLLAVISSLFLLTIAAYAIRMRYADWQPLADPGLLWVNTAVLVLSSAALQWAVSAARSGREAVVGNALLAAGALTAVFLAGQLWVWRELAAMGYFAAANPANAFFYMVTALHGAHLLGGLIAWTKTLVRLRRGTPLSSLRVSVELCAIYWHFLLAVWVVLFVLLLVT